MKTIAAIVDYPATRIVLAVLGLGVTLVFGAFSVILLITNATPGESLSAFLVGLGGCLGVVGWWSRLVISSGGLAKRPLLRKAVIVCLGAGIWAAVEGTSMFPRSTPGQTVLWLMAGVGILLLLGSLGTGPNKAAALQILRAIRERVAAGAEGLHGDRMQALVDLDAVLADPSIAQVQLLLAPTANLQELAIEGGWGGEFNEMAATVEMHLGLA